MKRPVTIKSIAPLLRIDACSNLSLQAQLRTRIIEAIDKGALAPGSKLSSSRKLAAELNVGRNTVLLAYQMLIAEGHLTARERSGVFVAERHTFRRSESPGLIVGRRVRARSIVREKLKIALPGDNNFRCPPDWQKYRYPFMEGRYDRSLFPVSEWREASRLALAVHEVEAWSTDNSDADDEALIDQIRTKLLPRRGVSAGPDEILITAGEQQALSLIVELFAGRGLLVGLEEPGLREMRELVKLSGAEADFIPVDDEGLVVGEAKRKYDLVYTTPSRQRPTGVTMSMERRRALIDAAHARDFIIVEDDFECELNYLHDSLPALYALDNGARVIYAASLSKVLAPGVRLGFLVAPPDVIAAARQLRDLTTRRPSPNNQRTAAFFLSLGHYDAMLHRLSKVFEERLIALRDALNHYRPLSIAIPPIAGGTAYWVTGPKGLDADRLVAMAQERGILIEPVKDFFAEPDRRRNMFRLGVTSIASENIRAGIKNLSDLMRAIGAEGHEFAAEKSGNWLRGQDLMRALSGATLLYKTVYGDPCTIELLPDGKMLGRAGYAGEDRDQGEWRVEGDLWHRRWEKWAYGEEAAFHVSIDRDVLHWMNPHGDRVDSALIAERPDMA
ncbi:PLP-dependent aminotransferase family protein [Hyphococcus sp.]|uniref:MocR-like pyridoxine biosynthesis transcription factor PdxR n=1 Tax=Hyphococcus sp. TaxID=2038636 RepID=UPI003CCC0312